MRVLAVDPERPDPAAIAEAADVLRAGGLVAFPTETVYGLGARALDEAAVRKIFAAKGRPSGHPLIAHVEGEAGARAVAAAWSDRASRLAAAFWPGPLTLVVPKEAHVPAAVTGGGDSIAVRAPAHPIARALIAVLGEPLAAPSANRYQSLSPTTAQHVVKGLGDAVDLVLDGGACHAGIESTVLDLRSDPPRVLRPGALDLASLRTVVPDVVLGEEVVAPDASRASPGMDARHYAPRARVVVCERAEVLLHAAKALLQSTRVGVVQRGGEAADGATSIIWRVLPDDPEAYARALFATLHELDDAGCELVVIEDVPDDDRWWAVKDRLRRAATPR
jgi:L-threonylcarbamoyladenylate synthase